MNGRTFSPNPRKRGKSHHHLSLLCLTDPSSRLLSANTCKHHPPGFSVLALLLELQASLTVPFLLTEKSGNRGLEFVQSSVSLRLCSLFPVAFPFYIYLPSPPPVSLSLFTGLSTSPPPRIFTLASHSCYCLPFLSPYLSAACRALFAVCGRSKEELLNFTLPKRYKSAEER